MFLCVFLISVTICHAYSRGTEILVDYLSDAGRISDYIAGTTDAPFFSKESYALLKKGDFKLVQVMIWLSRPHPQPPPFEKAGRHSSPDGFDQEGLKRELQIAKGQIRSIYEIGAEPLIFMVASNRPLDMKDFQQQTTYIINELRSSAIMAGRDLLLFRFGNEPESRFFWTGTREDFFETYRVWANTVKSISPNFIVEAPGFASATARYFKDEYHEEVNEFTREFLGYCRRNRVPLDIFSFHYYGTSIRNLSKEIRAVKKELARYASLSPIFGVPKIGIDEWNILVFGAPGRPIKIFDTPHTAAHNVGALISMLREGVWLSVRFGGATIGGPKPFEDRPFMREISSVEDRFTEGRPIERPGEDFLMIRPDGNPKPVYYGFSAFNKLYLTPIILKTSDREGVITIAGKSSDKNLINIILSFYDEELTGRIVGRIPKNSPDNSAGMIKATQEIKIKNFPWSNVREKVEIERFIVDDRNNLSTEDTKTILKKDGGGDISLEFKANTPSVVLLQVRWR